MPGVSSIAIAKQLEDASKRSRSIRQRVCLLLKAIRGLQILNQHQDRPTLRVKKWVNNIHINMRRLTKQREAFFDSVNATISICTSVNEERKNHIAAIEISRNRKIFDTDNRYVDYVIATPGNTDHQEFIHRIKKDIMGANKVKPLEKE